MNYNKTIIAGRICIDPKVRLTNSGLAVLRIPIAVNHYKKKTDGERVEESHFFQVIFFGKLAETVEKYMVKGQVMLVEGRLSTSKYTDKEGIERYTTEIIADTMQMGSKPMKSQNFSSPQTSPQKSSEPDDDIKLEDIPF
jgi:single-strand DNA-binding protein